MLDITAPDLADPATVTAQYRLAPLPRILSRDATLSWTDTLQDLAHSEAPTGPWRVTSDDIARTHSILNAAELRLSYLLSLPEGWDSYGAQPVQRDLAERALDVIRDNAAYLTHSSEGIGVFGGSVAFTSDTNCGIEISTGRWPICKSVSNCIR